MVTFFDDTLISAMFLHNFLIPLSKNFLFFSIKMIFFLKNLFIHYNKIKICI